jgi:hypothetical protein
MDRPPESTWNCGRMLDITGEKTDRERSVCTADDEGAMCSRIAPREMFDVPIVPRARRRPLTALEARSSSGQVDFEYLLDYRGHPWPPIISALQHTTPEKRLVIGSEFVND